MEPFKNRLSFTLSQLSDFKPSEIWSNFLICNAILQATNRSFFFIFCFFYTNICNLIKAILKIICSSDFHKHIAARFPPGITVAAILTRETCLCAEY